MELLAKLLATWFFVGLLPKAPGTWGSAAALPLAWALWKLGPLFYAAFTALLFLLGTWASGLYAERSKKEDPDEVVVDEVVGILTVFFFVQPTPVNLLFGLLLFRFFDVLKPPPVSWFEKLGGGWGIMADDAAAGVLAGLVLYSFQLLWK
ncbi:MAG: phosphatidylglycerophosphatase A [Aquificae bacterium]|nr:phosphatidylglycerophosphatase A [Aquificota bacterium]